MSTKKKENFITKKNSEKLTTWNITDRPTPTPTQNRGEPLQILKKTGGIKDITLASMPYTQKGKKRTSIIKFINIQQFINSQLCGSI